MFDWLRRLFGGGGKPEAVKKPSRQDLRGDRRQARYDAAQTTDSNRRHWAQSDTLSARQANNLFARSKLRERARYEVGNNGYAEGLDQSLANDTIGIGPRLQVQFPVPAWNKAIEERWCSWCKAIGWTEKLQVMTKAKNHDGEVFGLYFTNPAVNDLVQLDVKVIECDQVTTPAGGLLGWDWSRWVDGIEFDEHGNVLCYHLLYMHPGDLYGPGVWRKFERVPAKLMIHWFRKDRPGQARGVPEIKASLPLFAQMRRYTQATLTAAETAASFAVLLKTEAPADGETDDPTPFESLEIEQGMMTTLPAGADAAQMKAEHPTTQYPAFKQELLKEIGRPVNAPYNVTAGDSSPYNYSSARMDRIDYRTGRKVVRQHCEDIVLDPTFRNWYAEARLIPGYLPDGMPEEVPPHVWYWSGAEQIDPIKESKADTEALNNGTATLASILGERGIDWEQHLRQRAREIALMRELGLPIPEPKNSASTQQDEDMEDPEREEDMEDDEDDESLYSHLVNGTRRNGHAN